jgi:tetratricopeptide (TPR) repeat protein
LEYDEFGFPKPGEFRDEQKSRRAVQWSPGRVVLLVLGLLIAGGGAALVQFGPELGKGLGDLARGMLRNQLLNEEQKLRQFVKNGDFKNAINVCNRMLRVQPKNQDLHLLKVRLAYQESPEKALQACDEWKKSMPESQEPAHTKASILADTKQYKAAINECTEILRRVPNDDTALNNRAYFRSLARIDLQEAFEDVTKALEAEPNNYSYIDTRGYLHYLFGRFDKALADFNTILNDKAYVQSRKNDIGEIFFHRGLVYKHLKRFQEMERDFKEARARNHVFEEEPPPIVNAMRQSKA